MDGPVYPRQRLSTVRDVGRGTEGGDVLALEQQKLSWAIRGGAWGEIFPCLRLKDLWLRLSLAGSQALKLSPKQTPAHAEGSAPSSCFALKSSWITPWQGQQTNTLGILTQPVPIVGGRCQPRCPKGNAWAGAVALDLSVPEEAGLSRASHCLCLSAENYGNPFSPVLAVPAGWWEFSLAFPFFLLCSLLSFIPGSQLWYVFALSF